MSTYFEAIAYGFGAGAVSGTTVFLAIMVMRSVTKTIENSIGK